MGDNITKGNIYCGMKSLADRRMGSQHMKTFLRAEPYLYEFYQSKSYVVVYNLINLQQFLWYVNKLS